MESKLVWQNAGERTYVLVLDAGEEAFAAITAFAAATKLDAASLTAIGAFERATVGWFDLAKKTYKPIEIDSQCEGLSLLGDIAMGDDGKPSLHMHAVLGMSDGTTPRRPFPERHRAADARSHHRRDAGPAPPAQAARARPGADRFDVRVKGPSLALGMTGGVDQRTRCHPERSEGPLKLR